MSEAAAPAALVPVSMEEAVGYGSLDCAESAVEGVQVLAHDRMFLLVDAHGDVHPPGRCGLGLFFDDTRFLSHYRLRVSGGEPSLLSTQTPWMYAAQVDLAVTDREFGGVAWDPRNGLHVRRELLLDGERLTERVTLTNYLLEPVDLDVELEVGCDFADIFEVRGWRREERGQFFAPLVEEEGLVFAYRGLDGETMRTCVRFAAPPGETHPHGARWSLRLAPNGAAALEWEVIPLRGDADPPPAEGSLEERRRPLEGTYDAWRSECAAWSSDVEEFDIALEQAVTDLRGLHLDLDGGRIVGAGIPWYATAFGRDSIIASLQTLALNPGIARDTLRYLARHQGEREDPETEEQPGRIMHELRRGELARAGEIPHVPYYGTVDATPLWLVLLHEVWRWTGDRALMESMLPHAERALDWIDRYGDIDGDGLVEYASTSSRGLANQGWKDSGNGVPFPDGALPEPPIALIEVQGYVYDARERMSRLFAALGREERARRLRERAEALRTAIVERFWLEEAGTFALALDGRKRPVPTHTSNAGHLLWSRVPDARQAARMAEHFTAPEMFSGWGLRTLSSAHPVFNPMSYHNGSVWPHDNGIVALGLALQGQVGAALPILTSLYEASRGMRHRRLPELFCGMQRALGHRPVRYPVSCSPQAWATGSLFMMLQAVAGLLPDAPAGMLHVRAPALPPFLDELTVERLRVGRTRLSLQLRRHGDRTLVNLLELEGEPLRVQIELS